MGLIVLVRHGETDWNKAQRVMGTSGVGLNELGKTQMRWRPGAQGVTDRKGVLFSLS